MEIQLLVHMLRVLQKNNKACSKDLDKLQTDYMFKTGAKMISMTLLMVIAAILVGFFASKTAAGVEI